MVAQKVFGTVPGRRCVHGQQFAKRNERFVYVFLIGKYISYVRKVVSLREAVVSWLSLLHNFIQLRLNSGSAQAQTLLAGCW